MPRLALTVVGAALTAGALACVPLGCGEAPAPVRTESGEAPHPAPPPPTDSVLQEVRAALGGSGDATVALGALESLGDAAAPAIPDVERWLLARPVTTLGEPLAPEALGAFRVLERLGAREPLARAALARLAVEPGPNRAHAALGALRALADRDPALAADLDALLRDPDGKVRAEVLAALVADRARATARMPLLLALLDDPRPAVRALAAGGLGRAGRDGVAVLGNLLDRLATGGSDTDVRRALDAIGSEAPEALADALPADPGKALDDLVAIAQGLLDRLAPPARARLWHRLTAWWLSGASSPTPDGEESLAILLAGTGAREPEVNDPLLPAFESGDAARRVRAARLLARLPGRRALLIDRLASPEAGQREAALLGLARGHPADAKAERDLVLAALRDADPAVRAAAAVRVLDSAPVEGNLVGGFTPDHRKAIVAGLTHLLGTGAPDRRRLAASALRLFPESSPDAVVALGRVLEDGDDDLRALALVALQHAQQPLAPIAPVLVGVLERVRPAESPLVLGLVGRAGVAARAAAARVVALQSGTDLNVRIIAFQTLGRIDPPAEVALPALRADIHGPEEPVQMAALACATALGMTADPLAPELLQWFSDLLAVRTAKQPANTQQTEARRQLAALLGAMGRRSASVRAAALDVVRKGAPEDRPADLAALRELGTQEAAWREAYDTLLADPDEAVREAAKAGVDAADRPPPDPVAAVAAEDVGGRVRLLVHRRPDVRLRAVQLLAQMEDSLEPFADDVVAALEHPQSDDVRVQLLRLVPRLGGAAGRAASPLVLALQNPESPLFPPASELLVTMRVPAEAKVTLLRRCLADAPAVRSTVLTTAAGLGAEARALQSQVSELVRGWIAAGSRASRTQVDFGAAMACLAAIGEGVPGTWPTLVAAWPTARDETERHAVAGALRRTAPTAEDDPGPFFALLPEVPAAQRESMVQAVGRLGKRGSGAVPWLLERLREPSVDLREHAAKALDTIDPPASVVLPDLMPLVGSWGRPSATLLGRYCVEQTPAFLEALRSAKGPNSWQLVEVLETCIQPLRVRGQVPAVASALVDILVSPDARIGFQNNRQGTFLIGLLGEAFGAVERLLDATESPTSPTRDSVLALASMSDAARAAALSRLQAPSVERRLGALAVFARLSGRERSPAEQAGIAARLADGDPRVRFLAARALAVLFDGGRGFLRLDADVRRRALRVAVEALRTGDRRETWPFEALLQTVEGSEELGGELARLLLDEEDPKRAVSINAALRQHGRASPGPARAVLETALSSPDDTRRARAVYGWVTLSLERARAEQLLPALFAASRPIVRRMAVHASHVLDFGTERARPAVIACLRDPDAGVRDAAASSLVFTASADPATEKAFRAAIFDRALEGRAGLVSHLHHGGEAFVPILIEGLDDPVLRSACLSGLSSSALRGKTKAALPRLERLLGEIPDDERDQRDFVKSLIRGIGE